MYRKYFLKSSQPRLVTNLDVVNKDVESIFFRSTGSYKTKAANKSNSTFLFRTDTRHAHFWMYFINMLKIQQSRFPADRKEFNPQMLILN